MNRNPVFVSLSAFTSSKRPFGNQEGKVVYNKLSEFVEQNQSASLFGILMEGIELTDASFPRESVVSIAKQFRGEKGFFLRNLTDRDLIDNWSYAAKAKDQPLMLWNANDCEILGPDLSKATRGLVEFVLLRGEVLASQVADELGLSVQNASTRLKSLVTQGYLLRAEDVADSGGVEFKYFAIK
jgi:hypothetical protein